MTALLALPMVSVLTSWSWTLKKNLAPDTFLSESFFFCLSPRPSLIPKPIAYVDSKRISGRLFLSRCVKVSSEVEWHSPGLCNCHTNPSFSLQIPHSHGCPVCPSLHSSARRTRVYSILVHLSAEQPSPGIDVPSSGNGSSIGAVHGIRKWVSKLGPDWG